MKYILLYLVFFIGYFFEMDILDWIIKDKDLNCRC